MMRPLVATLLVFFSVLGAGSSGARCQEAAEPAAPAPAAKLEGTVARASYAMGLEFGANFRKQSIETDLAALIQGMSDGLAGKEPALKPEEMQAALKELAASLQKQFTARRQQAAADNLRLGAEFLLANGKKEGVYELASGIQYKVNRTGKGNKPDIIDRVTIHYRGTLIDGTEFDSSYGRGEPQQVNIRSAIRSWSEVLPLMNVGSNWTVYVPAKLAYGEEGSGERIPPNSVLIFEIELLAIN